MERRATSCHYWLTSAPKKMADSMDLQLTGNMLPAASMPFRTLSDRAMRYLYS